MNTRIAVGSVLIIALTALLLGCEPAGPVTSKGVLTRTSANPPLPPPPPPDPSATVAQQPVATQTAAANDSSAVPESAAAAPDATGNSPSGIPGVSAQGLPTGNPILQPKSTAPTSTAPAPSQPAIRLSAGVALPQTLPDGTQIGVSVDYRLTGQLKSSASYALVVETSAGELAIPVKVSPQGGTFQGFLPISVRPEHGPFKARIDEFVSQGGKGVMVSNRAELR